MLQGDTPLPTNITRPRKRVRGHWPRPLACDRDGAVTWQPPRPILVSRLERPLHQYTAETSAVDEQIGVDLLAALERQRRDKAVVGPESNLLELAFYPSDT